MAADKRSVKLAQAILAIDNPSIVIDGQWGRKSATAYVGTADKSFINSTIAIADPKLDLQKLSDDAMAGGRGGLPVCPPEVREAVERACDDTGIELGFMLGLISIESAFRTNVRNKFGYSGLCQMNEGSWSESAIWVRENTEATLGSFAENWDDAYQNALAGCAYTMVNYESLLRQGYDGDWTPATAYQAHQQGAAGFMQLYEAAKNKGKVSAGRVRGMANNVPPDGAGVTLKPELFLKRWTVVANERVAHYSAQTA